MTTIVSANITYQRGASERFTVGEDSVTLIEVDAAEQAVAVSVIRDMGVNSSYIIPWHAFASIQLDELPEVDTPEPELAEVININIPYSSVFPVEASAPERDCAA